MTKPTRLLCALALLITVQAPLASQQPTPAQLPSLPKWEDFQALLARVAALEAGTPTPTPTPVNCDLGAEVVTLEEPVGACRPNSTRDTRQVWTRPILAEPENGGEACGPTTGERVVSRPCTYVPPPPIPPGTSHNSHFLSMVARPDHWRSNNLQTPAFFGTNKWVTYDPVHDAAKIVIPAFYDTGGIAIIAPVSAAATVISVSGEDDRKLVPRNRIIKIGNEVMAVVTSVAGPKVPLYDVTVLRGLYGTTPTAHAAGAPILHATNSLRTQVRLPLLTEDGHTYLFGISIRYGASYMPKAGELQFRHPVSGVNVGFCSFGHKTFQFSSGGNDGDTIWLEPHMGFAGSGSCAPVPHVGVFGIRPYNKLGGDPNWALSTGDQLGPVGLGPRIDVPLIADRWATLVFRIRQRANDYDVIDQWVIDETREAVRVYAGGLVSVRPTGKTPNQIAKFWLEFNSSTDELLRHDQRDFVAHVKHFWALVDPPEDVSFALVKPRPK